MIERIVTARAHDLGGLVVGRVLPVAQQRAVGPVVFLDHMGPAQIEPGRGFDVRPHPHIGLATLTYLYEGEQVHRDSLGVVQTLLPHDANLMIAGRGVVHSERATPRMREHGGPLHGLQFWLALPQAHEDDAPSFQHRAAADLPACALVGGEARVVLGTFGDLTSPLQFPGGARLIDLSLEAGAQVTLDPDGEQLAVFVASGGAAIDGTALSYRQLAVLGGPCTLAATEASRIALFGGPALDAPRHLFWNFVASDPARLEAAKSAWRERRFPTIPGDDQEFIPLP